MSIYTIGREYLELISHVEEMEGDMTPEMQEDLLRLIHEGDDMLKACYYAFKNISGEVLAIDVELKRIAALKKSREASMDRLKFMMEQFMKITGKDKFSDGVVNMILAKKTDFSYSVFPREFIETVTTEKNKLAEFKDWAKKNPETAADMYGVKFEEVKYIQIK